MGDRDKVELVLGRHMGPGVLGSRLSTVTYLRWETGQRVSALKVSISLL